MSIRSQPFSPDGRRLVRLLRLFRRGHGGMRDCDVALVELDISRATAQPPRRLTTQRSGHIHSLAWTRDGSAIIYDALGQDANFSLWRVTIDGSRRPSASRTPASRRASLARSRDRLAFTRMSLDTDIYRFEVDGPVQLVTGSSFPDSTHGLSPTAVGSRLPPRGRPEEAGSGLPRLTDRTAATHPRSWTSIRARRPGRPTDGGLPLTCR